MADARIQIRKKIGKRHDQSAGHTLTTDSLDPNLSFRFLPSRAGDRQNATLSGRRQGKTIMETSMPSQLPASAIIRVSRGRFDVARFDEVDAMIRRTGEYLIPAIQKLPGLISYCAGTTRDGLTTQVSIWESEQAGNQMSTLPEIRDRPRGEADARRASSGAHIQNRPQGGVLRRRAT